MSEEWEVILHTFLKSVQLIISGKVQKIGFRNWLRKNISLYAADGVVRNLDSGAVEATLSASPNTIDHLVSLCRQGPKKAHVENVRIKRCFDKEK